jgi:hypothetical protein
MGDGSTMRVRSGTWISEASDKEYAPELLRWALAISAPRCSAKVAAEASGRAYGNTSAPRSVAMLTHVENDMTSTTTMQSACSPSCWIAGMPHPRRTDDIACERWLIGGAADGWQAVARACKYVPD